MALHLLPLLLAGTLTAPAASAGPAVSAAPAAEKKICRRTRKTESRMGSKRVCKTAEQWRAEEVDATSDPRAALSGKTR